MDEFIDGEVERRHCTSLGLSEFDLCSQTSHSRGGTVPKSMAVQTSGKGMKQTEQVYAASIPVAASPRQSNTRRNLFSTQQPIHIDEIEEQGNVRQLVLHPLPLSSSPLHTPNPRGQAGKGLLA